MTEIEKVNSATPEIVDDPAFTLDDYARLWREVDSRANWVKGEIAARVVTRYGENTLAEFAEKTGESVTSLRAYRTVRQKWDENSRRLEISWSVHQALASQEDRADLIASQETWTVDQARALVSERRAQAAESERRHKQEARQAEIDRLRETEPGKLTEQHAEKLLQHQRQEQREKRRGAEERRQQRKAEQRQREWEAHVHNAVRFCCLPYCGIPGGKDIYLGDIPGLAENLIRLMGADNARRLADAIREHYGIKDEAA